MKCLLICRNRWNTFFEPVLGLAHSAFMLPLANKPLVEFYLDICSKAGFDELRIVQEDPDQNMEQFIGDGGRWGVKVSWSLIREDDTFEQALKKNHQFMNSDKVLVVDGLLFPEFSIDEANKLKSLSSGPLFKKDQMRVILCDCGLVEHGPPQDMALHFSPLSDWSVYSDLAFRVMHSPEDYILPGYNNEPGIFIGKNVSIARGVNINGPVIIGDNVQLMAGTIIGPDVQIGNNVLIDTDCELTQSIIGDFAYVGSGLELHQKLVFNKKLIDKPTNCVLEAVDDFLIADTANHLKRSLVCRIIHFLLALLLLPILLLLGVISLVVGGRLKGQSVEWVGKAGHVFMMRPLPEPGQCAAYFLVDKLVLLMWYFAGRIELIGGRNRLNSHAQNEADYISPGVFQFSESLGVGEPLQAEIHDHYYWHNRSFFKDLKLIWRTFLKRWYVVMEVVEDE